MARLHLLTPLAITLLVSFPARAQEAATFHCTFKAVYETAESDNPTKSNLEKQFVGRRLDVLITDKPTAKVIGDVFTITKQASDYAVSQRGSMRNDWVLFVNRPCIIKRDPYRDHYSGFISALLNGAPSGSTPAWGLTLAVGTCE